MTPSNNSIIDRLDDILDDFYEGVADIDVDYGSVQKHEVKKELFDEAKAQIKTLLDEQVAKELEKITTVPTGIYQEGHKSIKEKIGEQALQAKKSKLKKGVE